MACAKNLSDDQRRRLTIKLWKMRDELSRLERWMDSVGWPQSDMGRVTVSGARWALHSATIYIDGDRPIDAMCAETPPPVSDPPGD